MIRGTCCAVRFDHGDVEVFDAERFEPEPRLASAGVVNDATQPLTRLSRSDRDALREVLIGATAAASRRNRSSELDALIASAPVRALPAAARLHRVAGSVHRGLRGVGDVSDTVMDELAISGMQCALDHLGFVGALSEIARCLDTAGLRWVVMKGPVLASLHYPDVGDRVYSDLDLLVDRRDFPAAVGVLEELGYGHSIHNWALAEAMLAGQVGLRRGSIGVDLHWHLHYAHEDRRPFTFDPEGMIERARRVDVSKVSAPTLDPVDTLLTVAFHAARSDGHALVWSKDIERVVAVEKPDFDELVRRCRDARCAPPVGVMLARSKDLLGGDIPGEVVASLVPPMLLAAHRVACRVSHPIQLHGRSTIARVVTRSVGPSGVDSIRSVPARGLRRIKRQLISPPDNETDDPVEKASYLEAVVSSHGR